MENSHSLPRPIPPQTAAEREAESAAHRRYLERQAHVTTSVKAWKAEMPSTYDRLTPADWKAIDQAGKDANGIRRRQEALAVAELQEEIARLEERFTMAQEVLWHLIQDATALYMSIEERKGKRDKT